MDNSYYEIQPRINWRICSEYDGGCKWCAINLKFTSASRSSSLEYCDNVQTHLTLIQLVLTPLADDVTRTLCFPLKPSSGIRNVYGQRCTKGYFSECQGSAAPFQVFCLSLHYQHAMQQWGHLLLKRTKGKPQF